MISFACTGCGIKLKVKTEFAGRASKCPACKQPVTVPEAAETQAYCRPHRSTAHPAASPSPELRVGSL